MWDMWLVIQCELDTIIGIANTTSGTKHCRMTKSGGFLRTWGSFCQPAPFQQAQR